MPVLINFKICDNAKECSAIAVCKTGALSWDEENKTIKIDNSKCTSCGVCVGECPIEAVKVAKDQEEFLKLKKEIAQDSRKASDLFVDRYGAKPISPEYLISEENFEDVIVNSNSKAVAELFSDNSIMCLLKSIPISDLFPSMNIKYRKVELSADSLIKKYRIKKLPALLFFDKGKFTGKIEGYYEDKEREKLIKQVRNILK